MFANLRRENMTIEKRIAWLVHYFIFCIRFGTTYVLINLGTYENKRFSTESAIVELTPRNRAQYAPGRCFIKMLATNCYVIFDNSI
jgi:hypothetical protein